MENYALPNIAPALPEIILAVSCMSAIFFPRYGRVLLVEHYPKISSV